MNFIIFDGFIYYNLHCSQYIYFGHLHLGCENIVWLSSLDRPAPVTLMPWHSSGDLLISSLSLLIKAGSSSHVYLCICPLITLDLLCVIIQHDHYFVVQIILVLVALSFEHALLKTFLETFLFPGTRECSKLIFHLLVFKPRVNISPGNLFMIIK